MSWAVLTALPSHAGFSTQNQDRIVDRTDAIDASVVVVGTQTGAVSMVRPAIATSAIEAAADPRSLAVLGLAEGLFFRRKHEIKPPQQ